MIDAANTLGSGEDSSNKGGLVGGAMQSMPSDSSKPKKRVRRTANEINRRFVCACGKAYGSEGSLNQHKKNKGHYSAVEQQMTP